jgi:hypothetical protein
MGLAHMEMLDHDLFRKAIAPNESASNRVKSQNTPGIIGIV